MLQERMRFSELLGHIEGGSELYYLTTQELAVDSKTGHVSPYAPPGEQCHFFSFYFHYGCVNRSVERYTAFNKFHHLDHALRGKDTFLTMYAYNPARLV